uniref:Malonyl-CoA:ACP transacylase (MAT) domain-containing protein n=1 Tax=Ditylenchus dipsaci TaxID=166011 RepID=A0A915E2J2_9BILA
MKPLLSCLLLPKSFTRTGIRCVRKVVRPSQLKETLFPELEQDSHAQLKADLSGFAPELASNPQMKTASQAQNKKFTANLGEKKPSFSKNQPESSPDPFKAIQNKAFLQSQEKITAPAKEYRKEKLPKSMTKVLKFDHIPIAEQVVVMFPGQGAQHLRMGEKVIDHPSSAALFEEASEFLQYNLLDICRKGPKSTLDQTIYCQMAVFVSSMAALEKLKAVQPGLADRITDAAGFSIGEYCALTSSGAISFQDALKVIKVRAEGMHECSQIASSGMMTVRTTAVSNLDLAMFEARKEAKEKYEWAICDVANYLYCGVKVVGGTNICLDYLESNANRLQYQVIKRLPVSGAFHTLLMAPAQQKVEEVLANITINIPKINIYSNFSGKLYPQNEAKIRSYLVKQISNPVKWEQIIQLLFRKHQDYVFPSYFEVGPGRQLGTILAQVSTKAYKNYVHHPC